MKLRTLYRSVHSYRSGKLNGLLSRVFHLFLKHGGQISVSVTGKRRNKDIRLEIPATYTFYHKKPSKIRKLIELIRDKEDKEDL